VKGKGQRNEQGPAPAPTVVAPALPSAPSAKTVGTAPGALHPTPPPNPAPPRSSPEPAVPEVVMADVDGEDEIEDFSDMEGVQREGLFDSRHAPPPGEPDYMTHSGVTRTEKGEATWTKRAGRRERTKASDKKGKRREIVRDPATGTNTVPVAPRTILK
jgi:hypothetical protein